MTKTVVTETAIRRGDVIMQGCKKGNRQEWWRELNLGEPYFANESVALYHGDGWQLLPNLPDGAFDAIITDPPYCSGGDSKSMRDADPVSKYCQNNNACGRPTFGGDNRDSRSFKYWMTTLLGFARRASKESAYALVFSDWRQLPTMTDVLQAAGFAYKGVVAWDKGRGARAPHKGYFRHQAEFIAWGTNGKVPRPTDRGPFDGVIQEKVRQADKHHITGKPTDLMRQLVNIVPNDGLILDCFAGSGTTAVAAAIEGRRCVAIEQSEEYCEIAKLRFEIQRREAE